MPTEEQRRLLGAFVRARREGLRPDEPGRRRRTPGLRREELAARAGIGVTWCAWIEQGRDVRASADTLSRLARALCLTPAERAYLFELAERHDPDNPTAPDGGEAPASIAALVAALGWPAYGLDPGWTVCAANAAARRLFVGLFDEEGGRPNLLRYVFTAPEARRLLPDWESRACRLLAEFRADYGRHLTDPRARSVIDWLTAHSEAFRQAWERQDVLDREGGLRLFLHPQDGALRFEQHTVQASDRSDFKLVALQPLPPA
ncbi:transcriptional regulator with XRE-family HTH domain [Sphingobium jiangsuense]|uniref:Transcriptional regulator with XRE-family HTH domain n=1 Tax=Sphingobium jiangsuense TaxID=870476 RepID=A0A7W6FQZ8_9SPHN|nr:helix-turn-helix transcriptional regulator [Sphingobium jiangsuense]MBB3927448.1 transcriptional regulator with XRE-family HTH domain [Sphingobium jiangsuense]